jgi:hypothetical protein
VIHLVVRSRRSGPAPDGAPSRRPSVVDGGQGHVDVAGEDGDQPRHRRVRRHRTEHRRRLAQHGDVGQAISADRERHGHIKQDLRRVVERGRTTPPLQGQQHRTGLGHHPRPGGVATTTGNHSPLGVAGTAGTAGGVGGGASGSAKTGAGGAGGATDVPAPEPSSPVSITRVAPRTITADIIARHRTPNTPLTVTAARRCPSCTSGRR